MRTSRPTGGDAASECAAGAATCASIGGGTARRRSLLVCAAAAAPSSGRAWGRCRWRAPRRVSAPCSTATTGCCAPTRRRTGAGVCRSRSSDVDPRYLAMLIAFEDQRFRTPSRRRSVGGRRAPAGSSSRHGRIVSGGSTLTMQVARLLDGEHERTAARQAAPDRCARCSSSAGCPRTRSCALYLRLAPFGGNLEGVRAASLAYFGKEPRRLSLGEAALLVALPQSPECAAPGPLPAGRAARAQPRAARARSRPASSRRRRPSAPWPSGCRRRAASSPCWRRTWPTPRWRANDAAGASPDASIATCRPASRSSVREHAQAARASSCRPPWSPSTTAPARWSPTSARPATSTRPASAPST